MLPEQRTPGVAIGIPIERLRSGGGMQIKQHADAMAAAPADAGVETGEPLRPPGARRSVILEQRLVEGQPHQGGAKLAKIGDISLGDVGVAVAPPELG